MIDSCTLCLFIYLDYGLGADGTVGANKKHINSVSKAQALSVKKLIHVQQGLTTLFVVSHACGAHLVAPPVEQRSAPRGVWLLA